MRRRRNEEREEKEGGGRTFPFGQTDMETAISIYIQLQEFLYECES
jgi:hypothetical protein